jgi:cation diffusion facilitator CzcD-associated flavoprotein CzcO
MSGEMHPIFSQPPVYHHVVIVGAGLSGLCAAIQLKRKLGITDVRILEKEDGVSGTWHSNSESQYIGLQEQLTNLSHHRSLPRRRVRCRYHAESARTKYRIANTASFPSAGTGSRLQLLLCTIT